MINFNGRRLCENCFEEMETDAQFCTHCGYNPATGVSDPTFLMPGSVLLGKYIIGKVMGKGGFGITYLAYNVNLGKKVAIKEFFPYGIALRASGTTTVSVSSMDNADAFKLGAEKFYNEAKLVSKFNGNPNIVGVYEFFYENDTVYFAMEYLKGHTLKEHIQQGGPLNAAQAVFIAQNIANALMAAHSSSVLHRDISPDNIIICDNGDVKLIDFGAARQVVAEHSQSFSVILKPGFAPLEQYQKKGKQGPWTDIYSLGATIYYALTEDILEDPMSRLDDDKAFQSNQYNIDPELWSIITKATELKIDDRYADIFQFKNDLAKVSIEAEPLVVSAEKPVEKMPEFQTAMPYGMSQSGTSQPKEQPVGGGGAPVLAPAPASAPAPAPASAPASASAEQPVPNAASQNAAAAAAKPKIGFHNKKFVGIIIAAVVCCMAVVGIIIGVNAPKDVTDMPYSYDILSIYDGNYVYIDTEGTYTGKWQFDMPNGEGTFTSINGDVYKGEWKNGKSNGQGTMTYSDGDVYEGEWKDGKSNGQGTITYANGSVYKGEWKDDKPNGQGTATYIGGDVYVGEWKDDLKSGQGTYTWADGDAYEGEWKDDKPNGQGTYTWADGRVYKGGFKDGVKSGQGTFIWNDGNVYVGEYKDDLRNGQGTMTYDSGDVYVGGWKDNKRNGYGIYTFADGEVYEGEWKNGEFIG